MNLGLSVFLEVLIHIALLAYVFNKNTYLQEISPEAGAALIQLFLGTGFVIVALKGSGKDTWTYITLVFFLFVIAGIVGEYVLSPK